MANKAQKVNITPKVCPEVMPKEMFAPPPPPSNHDKRKLPDWKDTLTEWNPFIPHIAKASSIAAPSRGSLWANNEVQLTPRDRPAAKLTAKAMPRETEWPMAKKPAVVLKARPPEMPPPLRQLSDAIHSSEDKMGRNKNNT